MPPLPLAQQSQQQLDNIRTALAHEQTELAVTLLATLQQNDPANPQALLLVGTLQMQHGKPQEALSSLLSASYQLPKPPTPEMAPDTLLPLRLLITGTVQGVGYRQWLADELTQRELAVWVRNLPDGSVEAVIHGSLEHLQPLCDGVLNGPEKADVTGLNVTQWEGETPEGVAILDTH